MKKTVEINLDEIKLDDEFYFNDDDVVIIDETFKNNLPAEHKHNLSKLFDKLSAAPFGEVLATPFNSEKTLITYAKLDYSSPDVKFDRSFDEIDKLILNAIYSFYRAGNMLFTSRSILQHLFGNITDHFQSELVEIIEQHLSKLKYMRFSMDLKDKFGNDAAISRYGKKNRPIAIE